MVPPGIRQILLSYVRASWGNKEGAVTVEQIAEQR
jgi:hypothetical protein